MSEISQAIDRFLSEYAAPSLREAGFAKQGRRWRRLWRDRAEVISIQSSGFNLKTSGSFYADVGVVIPTLSERLYDLKVDLRKATGCESAIRSDIGHLTPEGRQGRWTVNLEGDNSEQGKDFRNAILTYALPWFERSRDEAGFMEFLSSIADMETLNARAILYSDAGNYPGAREMLKEIVQRRPDLRTYVEKWAAKRKLFPQERRR